MSQQPSPAEIPGLNDPGDATTNRYSYQWAYTAILACSLFDTDGEIAEIYCEHHDDILVKSKNAKFHAVQVKTRQLGSELWKAGDDDIVGALAKFAQLEQSFGTHFWRYTIATNHQFFEVRENGSNLPHLLQLAQAIGGQPPAGILATFIKKLGAACSCDIVVVLAMLKKAHCDHRLPKLDGIRKELCDTICRSSPQGQDATYAALSNAADELTAEVQRACSLQHAQTLPLYLSLCADGVDAEIRLLLNGKRLTLDRIKLALGESLALSELLSPANPTAPHPPTTGQSRLKLKMNAGGLSAMTVDAAHDCYSSALKQQREWASKYGEKKALQRYHHLSTVIRAEAAQAYEDAKATDKAFGRETLNGLRNRIRQRRADGTTALFNCTDEHLIGYASILTDECKVWWSLPFTLPEAG